MRRKLFQPGPGLQMNSRPGVPRAIRPLAFLAILLTSACDHRVEIPTSRLLQPGDSDYPEINPSPAQIVQFTAIVPEGLSAEFHLVYGVATPEDGPNLSMSPACRWSPTKPFYVDVQLKLAKSGNSYRGSFSPDYFQSGACGWHLADITSPMLTTWVPSDTSGPVIFFDHSLHSNSHPYPFLDLAAQRSDIWCTRTRNKSAAQSPKDTARTHCTPFVNVNDLPKGFADSVPLDNRDWNVHGTQYLQSLTVEFHDLDVLIPAYVESHK
jgi:hypothetical protein